VPRRPRSVPGWSLWALVAGVLLVAGGLWVSFDPKAGDSGLPLPSATTTEEVMPTGTTPPPSGSPRVTVKPKAKPSPSTQKPKPSAPVSRPPSKPPVPAPQPTTPKPVPSTPRPPVTPPPTTPPQTSTTYHALFLINGERKEAGAASVARYTGMDAYCQDWAEEMDRADTLVHSPHSPYSAEVIASGATSATQAVQLWMNSPPHRDIILNPAYTKVGIGYSDGYWCAVFS
jgi:uncharacterized protein YkwD